jgi:dienelactone hydrolase
LERCGEEMNRFLHDRRALRRRLQQLVDVVANLHGTDPDLVAALGFCFGGLCVLDLARIGAPVRAVASFHGVLTGPEQDDEPPGDPLAAKVIVFHGWDDPFAPPEGVTALGRELTGRGVDWQLHAYGLTMHSFMATAANNPEAGILYNETSARRAWRVFEDFLAEAFA